MATLNINDLYKAAEEARQKQYQSAKTQSQNRLDNSLAEIESDYRTGVTSAQTAARISALGQEEKLAAAGLNFGSAYDRPTSGYAETSRVVSDNNLRSNLNQLATTRNQARSDAQNQYSTEVSEASQARYEALSQIRLEKAQATINYNQQQYENALERWKTYGYVLPADAKTLGVKAGTQTSSQAYNQAKLALERIKAFL